MAVYVIAILAVALVLYLSFRALAMEPAGAQEGRAVAEVTLAGAASGARRLIDSITDDGELSPDGEGTIEVVARSGRRRAAAHEQQLSRLDVSAWEPPLIAARELLMAGLEDLGWACRLRESSGYPGNPGMQSAVAQLVTHARECTEEAVARIPGDRA